MTNLPNNWKQILLHILISAAIGALVTFLTQLLQGVTGLQSNNLSSITGGGAAMATYAKRVFFS